MSELFKTLLKMNEQRMNDYQAGFLAGYKEKEKELLEEAEKEEQLNNEMETERSKIKEEKEWEPKEESESQL